MAVDPALRLTGEDLTFWWADSPMQPTTMAMLLVLDRPPAWSRLRAAVERALIAVPRLRQRVVEAPLDVTLPHWETDPTFDLDYHLRRHTLSGAHDLDELFCEIAPAYETPFDRSRPLWEARLYEGLGGGHSALFFKLHHAVADGVGGNAIFAAMSDWERDPGEEPDAGMPGAHKGPWAASAPLGRRLAEAVRDRVALDLERARASANVLADTVMHPSRIPQALAALRSLAQVFAFDSHSPLKRRGAFGRARRLAGMDLPFEDVRRIRHALRGTMIDVILSIMAGAMGKWHRAQGMAQVVELMTLVPVNLRRPEEWAEKANVGNVATGLLVPLPIGFDDPIATFHEVRRRVEEKKADPAAGATPALAEVLAVLGRQLVTWMGEVTFGAVDFIVTNVPGILATRYLAGTAILAAYPFAPVALRSPASIALYGYRDRLFIGIDADETVMPDVDAFRLMIDEAFTELAAAAGVAPSTH
ncbi:MAG TPA: wax ester/triacylglycerol synthase domain-containing protein [Candidatus Eisenbacteria bacterium]|nr:wax ester/triacylglycerol synthase domain-containing protein [Candidatus Eisenbacteria bacterium]